MPMILTPAQAEAIYSAMCALNNICATGMAGIGDHAAPDFITVNWHDGDVEIRRGFGGLPERHTNQSAFATAYGLQQG